MRGDVRAASAAGEAVLVRVHSLCPVGDSLGIKPELSASLRMLDEIGLGVCLCVYNKARTSLEQSFRKVVLREDAAPAKTGGPSEALRDFGLGAQVLADLGIHKVRLMSNSTRRIAGIEGFGIEVVERVPLFTDDPTARPQLRPVPAPH